MTKDEIIEAFHSEDTLTQITRKAGIRYNTVKDIWEEVYGAEAVKDRKRLRYRASKLGANNPMKGRYKKLHPNWLDAERVSDRKGYYRVRAPDWYTGRVWQGYVDEHVIAYCKSRGITEVPSGFVVHHLDMDKKNNEPSNLVMLTNSDHLLLHAWINRAIVQRLSKLE
jgi:hypothetical protein